MATITDVEQTEAFKTARELVREVYRLTKSTRFARDFALVDQIRRAAVSIISNISEGFERDGNKELIQFLSVAKGSIGEVKAQLIVALDQGYVEASEYDRARELCASSAKQLAGWMTYLRQSAIAGHKFAQRQPRIDS